MPEPLRYAEVTAVLADLPGWAAVGEALHSRWDAPDVPTAVRVVTEVFAVAEEMDHHPDTDLRWRRLRFELQTHTVGAVTELDVRLAREVDRICRAAGARQLDAAPVVIEVGIDTSDVEAVAPFWEAALGLRMRRTEGTAVLDDPGGLGPQVWFQVTDSPAPGRNRLHVDVAVEPARLEERRAAVEAAGGRLVTDRFAPAWWVYADADGNEVCLCTPLGRDQG